MCAFSVSEALDALPADGRHLLGNGEAEFARAAALAHSAGDAITYLKRESPSALAGVSAACVIVPAGLAESLEQALPAGIDSVILSPNPRLDFIRVLGTLFAEPAAVVALAGPGPDHSRARISDDAVVHPAAMLGECSIGSGSVVEAGAVIHDRVSIGSGCVIAAGAVIGGPGFGFERDEAGVPIRFPHIGGIEIGDRVEVGSNACIDRGTLGNTVIGDDVKIDNLVHVAHNVRIGARTLVAASAVIAGSAVLGEDVWVGPLACVSNGVTVGAGASVSLGAVVTRTVVPHTRVTGNFAVEHDRFLRQLRSVE